MEKVKEQKRERTRVPLARRATAVKVDYYCAPSCSVLTARGQGNQSVQALPGRAGSFLDSVAPRQRQPKTIAAMQRAAGLVSGSCGSRQEGGVEGSVGSVGSVGGVGRMGRMGSGVAASPRDWLHL